MKKLLSYTLLLLLAAITTPVKAQTWDFTAGLSDADKALLKADATNWYDETDKNRYERLTEVDGALTANGTELAFTKGLKLTAAAGKDKTNGKIRLEYKKNRLGLNGSNIVVTIPSLKAGQTVTVECQTTSKTAARKLTPGNLTITSGFTASLDQTTNVGTVTADGDVTLTTEGGMNIASIKVTTADGGSTGDNTGGNTGGDDTPAATHNVSRNATQNQMLLTLNDGSQNCYNTNALSTVGISDDNTTITVSTTDGDDTYKNLKQIAFAKADDSGSGDITNEDGKVNITEAKGWQESAYAKWEPFTNATSYHVYIKGGSYSTYTRIDQQLVRNYGSYGRADMVGLAAGTYSLKVVPVIGGAEKETNANEATNLAVVNYDRAGFAHKGYSGVGAYKDDGTLKDDAIVLYVSKDNFNTITADLVSSSKGTKTTYTGLGEIFYGKQKGLDKTPIDVRVIGCITDADAASTQRKSDQAGLLLKGKSETTVMDVTIEGIGEDAMFYGFGLGLVNGTSVEVRNMAFGLQGSSDDDMEIKSTQHVWVHNNDYFYGQKGSGDHGKGDGSLDSKDDCTYATFSYNRFHDSGKCNLCGMKSEHTTNLLCYHHNWFDHSDSRHPRVRTSSVHVWNNYYDGCAKYGIGATSGCSIFSENNYFRHTSKPMLSSMQGTDAKGDGTFSGEDGGIIKSFGNVYAETEGSYYKPITQNESATSFDVIEVTSRDEQVPDTYKTKQGGTTYNNFDTDASLMYTYTPDAATDVPTKVTGYYGAGRLNHGDIQYTIPNTKDKDYGRLSELDAILSAYKTSLVGLCE